MFTGIITHLGKFVGMNYSAANCGISLRASSSANHSSPQQAARYSGSRIKKSVFTFIANPAFCKKISKGTSIAINGVCLTAFAKPTQNSFSVEIMPETAKKTTLGQLKKDDTVNLELPVTPQSFLSGHFVQGHIDSAAKLISTTKQGNSHLLKFCVPVKLSKYIAEKGSIAINGISLTIIDVKKDYFTVGIIPYTWNNTMFKTIKPNDFVNIEVDILAKYVEKLLKK